MSQNKVFSETIDGVEYRMRPLPPRVALHFLRRILAIVAPGVGSAIDNIEGGLSGIMEMSVEKIGLGNLITGAFSELSDKDLDWANDLLSRQCEVVLGPNEAPRLSDIFDVHFQGRIRHWFSWVTWAAKTQYADFFDDSAPNDGPPS